MYSFAIYYLITMHSGSATHHMSVYHFKFCCSGKWASNSLSASLKNAPPRQYGHFLILFWNFTNEILKYKKNAISIYFQCQPVFLSIIRIKMAKRSTRGRHSADNKFLHWKKHSNKQNTWLDQNEQSSHML